MAKKCATWVVASTRKISGQEVRKFIGDLVRMGRDRGMEIPEPLFENIELDALPTRMEQLCAEGVVFLMYIDNRDTKSHSILKLNEKRYGVLTLHVTIEVASNACAMTLNNVLAKMNMKLNSLNYVPIMPPGTENFNA